MCLAIKDRVFTVRQWADAVLEARFICIANLPLECLTILWWYTIVASVFMWPDVQAQASTRESAVVHSCSTYDHACHLRIVGADAGVSVERDGVHVLNCGITSRICHSALLQLLAQPHKHTCKHQYNTTYHSTDIN